MASASGSKLPRGSNLPATAGRARGTRMSQRLLDRYPLPAPTLQPAPRRSHAEMDGSEGESTEAARPAKQRRLESSPDLSVEEQGQVQTWLAATDSIEGFRSMLADVVPTREEMKALRSVIFEVQAGVEVAIDPPAPATEAAPRERNFSRPALGAALPRVVARIPQLAPEHRQEALNASEVLIRHVPPSDRAAVVSEMIKARHAVMEGTPDGTAATDRILSAIHQVPASHRKALSDALYKDAPAILQSAEHGQRLARWEEEEANAKLHGEIRAAAEEPDDLQRFASLQRCVDLLSVQRFEHSTPDLLVEALLTAAKTLGDEQQVDIHSMLASTVMPHEHVAHFARQMAGHLAVLGPEHRLRGMSNLLEDPTFVDAPLRQAMILHVVLDQMVTGGLMAESSPEDQSAAYNLCARNLLPLPDWLGAPLMEDFAGRKDLKTNPDVDWTPEQINAVARNLQQGRMRPLQALHPAEFPSYLNEVNSEDLPPAQLPGRLDTLMRTLPDMQKHLQSNALDACMIPFQRKLPNAPWSAMLPTVLRLSAQMHRFHLTDDEVRQKVVTEAELQQAGLLRPDDIRNADDGTLAWHVERHMRLAVAGELGHGGIQAGFHSIPPQQMPLLVANVVRQLRGQVQQGGDDPQQGLKAWQDAMSSGFVGLVSSLNVQRRFMSLLNNAANRGAAVYSSAARPLAQALAEMRSTTQPPEAGINMMLGQGRRWGANVSKTVYSELADTLPRRHALRGSCDTPAIDALVDWAIQQPGEANMMVKAQNMEIGLRAMVDKIPAFPDGARRPARKAFIHRLEFHLNHYLQSNLHVPRPLAMALMNNLAPYLDSHMEDGPEQAHRRALFVQAANAVAEPLRRSYVDGLPPQLRATAQQLLGQAPSLP